MKGQTQTQQTMNQPRLPIWTMSPADHRSRLTAWLGTLSLMAIAACLIRLVAIFSGPTEADTLPIHNWGDAWNSYFLLLLVGAVICGLIQARSFRAQNWRHRAARAAQPNEAWLRSDWCVSRLANRHDKPFFLGLMWLVGMALASGNLFDVTASCWAWPGEDIFGRLMLLIGMTVCSLAFYPISAWILLPALRRWRFGASMLVLPGTGNHDMRRLEAVVRVPKPGFGPMEFEVMLVQVERTQHHDSEGRTGFFESAVLTFSREHSCVADGNMLEVPMQFDLPADCKPSTSTGYFEAGHAWKLQVFSKRPWFDYRAEFEVPVFRCAKSNVATASQPN